MAAKLECINPILCVKDLRASLNYYAKVLGFEKADWVTNDSTFALVLRDGLGIYLSQNAQGHPGTWVWVGAEDIEPIYAEYRASGANVLLAPTNYSWAYEMRVGDPDGNVLRIGSAPKDGVPFNDGTAGTDSHGDWTGSCGADSTLS
jgi:predicted lactoylglutathione lyase